MIQTPPTTSADDGPPSFMTSDFRLAYAAHFASVVVLAVFYRFGDLIASLGGSSRMLGVLVAIGCACGIVARTQMGTLVTRFGLLPVWLGSALAMALGAAVLLVVPDAPGTLLIGRILFATGAAGALGLPMLFVQKTTPPESRVEALSFLSSGFFLGLMVGVLLGEALSLDTTKATLPTLFLGAAVFGVLAALVVLRIALKRVPLVFEALPTSSAETAPWVAMPSPVLVLAGAVNFAFSFCTIFLTRFVNDRGIGGFFVFFFTYCAAAFTIGLLTKSWGKLVGAYRMILLGVACYAFGNALLLMVSTAWHLALPAIACGASRALCYPSLLAFAERSEARTVSGRATNRALLAMDVGLLVAALSMGLLIDAVGYTATICVASGTLLVAGTWFAVLERKAAGGAGLKRRRDDFRARRKADHGVSQYAAVTGRTALVYVKRDDGLRLDGAWHLPEKDSKPVSGAAVLMIHADGDDFTSPSILETLQHHYTERGAHVLRVNTSGKGVIGYYNVSSAPQRHGSVFETLDESLPELDLWMTWLVRQGFSHVTLVGHRLGAIKAMSYAGRGSMAANVERVVALAPPRLRHASLRDELGEPFLAEAQKAAELVATGHGEELFEAATPHSTLTSARSFHDKYGEASLHDVVSLATEMITPTLFVLATLDEREVSTAKNLNRDLKRVADLMGGIIAVAPIAGANSYFSNVREKAVLAVEAWIQEVNGGEEENEHPDASAA